MSRVIHRPRPGEGEAVKRRLRLNQLSWAIAIGLEMLREQVLSQSR